MRVFALACSTGLDFLTVSVDSFLGCKRTRLIMSEYEHQGVTALNDKHGNLWDPAFTREEKLGTGRLISSRYSFSGGKVQRGTRLFLGLCSSEGFSNILLVNKYYISD